MAIPHKNDPIGIFDSGIGGMTVARAITSALPNENLVYFGDTAHFPYGDKSTAAIQAYAVKICQVLLQQKCKVIVIACNSASASAYDLVKEYVGSKVKVVNVIEPTVNYVGKHFGNKKIGVIGTKRTVDSNVYKLHVDLLEKNIELKSLATPLLAPMIEEGFYKNELSDAVIAEYLSNKLLNEIEALILGCTHYPLIKEQIDSFYKNSVEVLDSASIVAEHLKNVLSDNGLLNDHFLAHRFFVSDITSYFEKSATLFFGKKVDLQLYKLWE